MEKEHLLSVINALISKSEHDLAKNLIDFFYKNATKLEEFDALGEASIKAKYYEMQLKCALNTYTRCTTPESLYAARENLYKAYNTLNFPEKAMFYIEQNLLFKPNDVDTLASKAFTYALLGNKEKCENILETLIAKDEKQKENIEYALAGKQLREGKTALGIRNFVGTFKPKNIMFEERLKLKFWDGMPQPGKTIIVNGEGGIGDEIINIRFFKHLSDLGMRPILYSSWYKVRPDLALLFRRHGYEVMTNPHFFHKDWLWTHMMALPGYLGLTEDDLWYGPYLKPLRQDKNKLNDKKFKIGIKCSGNPYFEQDIYRTIPVEEMISILPTDASIYYIDKGTSHPGTISLSDRIDSWEDTLDFIDQMDIIVSSCTSLVHAAGAMGKKTIVIVPISEYYTWTSTRPIEDESTPWYGENLILLKQTELRSWNSPLIRAKEIINDIQNSRNGSTRRRKNNTIS